MFELNERVNVVLSATLALPGTVIKVSFTQEGRWYGVKLDNGPVLHGLSPKDLIWA